MTKREFLFTNGELLIEAYLELAGMVSSLPSVDCFDEDAIDDMEQMVEILERLRNK